jgi:signal transduction histidine kinase
MKPKAKPAPAKRPLVVLGVTGSIAAYKAAEITSQLARAGCSVHVVLTADAQKFITPLVFKTLSRNPVVTDLYDEEEGWKPTHIRLADEADLLLLAPATANVLAKCAAGRRADVHRPGADPGGVAAGGAGDEREDVAAPGDAAERGDAGGARGPVHRTGGGDVVLRLRGPGAVVAGGTDRRPRPATVRPSRWARPPRRMINWSMLRAFAGVWVTPPVDPHRQANRIDFMEENVCLPVKGFILAWIFYVLYLSGAFEGDKPVGDLSLRTVRIVYWSYVAVNLCGAVFLLWMKRFPIVLVQWVVFAINLIDAAFLASCTVLTGAMKDLAYWVFLGLIVRNSVSVPVPLLQVTLNLLVIVAYVAAGIFDQTLIDVGVERLAWEEVGKSAAGMLGDVQYLEAFAIRVFLMLLVLLCCYGVQVLFDKQRIADEELEEFHARQEQLQTAGRLAAEIAHQVKNPLSIINNAVFALQRFAPPDKPDAARQLQIIRDEVDRSDRILTELMGYAQLAEGKVESLDVLEELEAAIQQVVPPGASYPLQIQRSYAGGLPRLQMQRGHLREVFVNLLQNARDAMPAGGRIELSARPGDDYTLFVTIADTGPGIPPESLDRIFEPYFTTKERGTGLGLAIVKHNVEIYGGTVRVESGLGKGTRFSLQFRAKTMLRFRT